MQENGQSSDLGYFNLYGVSFELIFSVASLKQLEESQKLAQGISEDNGVKEELMEDAEAKLTIEERFQEAQMQREIAEKMEALDNQATGLDGDAEIDPQLAAAAQDQDGMDEEDLLKGDANKAVSDEYRTANIRVIDGIEFERVGDDWFPVTTKDPKERSQEEKKIVALERVEKAAMRTSRRDQMVQKLMLAGLPEEQAKLVVESKLQGKLADVNVKKGKHGGGQAQAGGLGLTVTEMRGKGAADSIETAEEQAVRMAVEADKELFDDSSEQAKFKSWFDRKSVRDRLDERRFINCADKQNPEIPSTEGLRVVPPLKAEQFLWKPNPEPVNGTEEFLAGPVALEAAVMANAAAQLDVSRAPVMARMWGKCALVGNSGMLRMSNFGKSIDSHDTVLRINQAPVLGYSRRVGTMVTHRVFNRLWARLYYTGQTQSQKKNKVQEQYPLETNLTLLITRATLKEYGLLAAQLADTRPDVLAARISSRACSMAQPLLEGYRERLCHQGFGPYKGLNVPSSGWVAGHMLLQLCTSVSVYGFGVEGMQKASRGLPTGMEEKLGRVYEAVQKRNITYHYFSGLGSRKEGNDVHSFDTEEKTFEALSNAGYLTFCRYREGDDEHNWRCGCQDPTGESCMPEVLDDG
eukprot:gene4264-5249_t